MKNFWLGFLLATVLSMTSYDKSVKFVRDIRKAAGGTDEREEENEAKIMGFKG